MNPDIVIIETPNLGDRSYVVGHRGTAVVVDPQRDIDRVYAALDGRRWTVTHVVETHVHNDYVSGGLVLAEELGAEYVVPVGHDYQFEATQMGDGDTFTSGHMHWRVMHTPGHTPGSQRVLLDGRLVAGDTLFLAGCGRTDFPGGNVDDMFRSLQALAALPGDPTVFPGHWYSAEPSAPLEDVRRTNYVYRASNLDQWRMLMGG